MAETAPATRGLVVHSTALATVGGVLGGWYGWIVGTPPYGSEGFAYAAPLGVLGVAGGLAAYVALLGLRASTKQGNGWSLVRRVLGMTVAVTSVVGLLVLGGWLGMRIYEGLTGNVVHV